MNRMEIRVRGQLAYFVLTLTATWNGWGSRKSADPLLKDWCEAENGFPSLFNLQSRPALRFGNPRLRF